MGHFDPFSDTFPYYRDFSQDIKTPLELHVLKGCLGSQTDTFLYQLLFPLNNRENPRFEPEYAGCARFRMLRSA